MTVFYPNSFFNRMRGRIFSPRDTSFSHIDYLYGVSPKRAATCRTFNQ